MKTKPLAEFELELIELGREYIVITRNSDGKRLACPVDLWEKIKDKTAGEIRAQRIQ